MSIPTELETLPQWVAWRMETRETPKGPKRTKVPYNPRRHDQRASSTDLSTWGTYEQAVAAEHRLFIQARPALGRTGVGFVFSPGDPYVGVDMDDCVSRTGLLHRGANEIVRALDGYVEWSPSGAGVHVIVRAQLERGRHTLKTPWDGELAIYDRGRFFTMLGEGQGEIREAQGAVDQLLKDFWPDPIADAPVSPREPICGAPSDVLDRIHADPRMAALWAGDCSAHGDDHSAADMALCAHLAYLTGDDPAAMDSLFRASGLYREKWNQPRGDSTYGRMTIERAIRVHR